MLPSRENTHVWMRNPIKAMRQMAELGFHDVTWDAGFLYKRPYLIPQMICDKYFGVNTPWNSITIDDRHATHYVQGRREPVAVYPVWNVPEMGWSNLEQLVKKPWGYRKDLVLDQSVPVTQRPLWGQPHVIIISRPPNYIGSGIQFYSDLGEFIEAHEK